eukprot:scaffold1688_cov91-Phaeocystis_antarctica.AAC.1
MLCSTVCAIVPLYPNEDTPPERSKSSPRRASHRCQLHRPEGHLLSPSSGGRDYWVEDKELRVGRSCAA